MKFTNLKIENFLTLGKAEARLDERGLVLVQGDNRDDTSQNSNGAGKSSLADAVSWVLFGITARGESGNDVINNTIKRGGATVSLEINDDGNYYRVERTRLKGKGTLEVERKEKGSWVSLTKGTTKLTQDMLDKLIGCSAEVFNNAIYSGQEKMPDLPGMTDKMLKMLIEEAAGILQLERAYKVARERMNDVTKSIAAQEIARESGERVVDNSRHRIDALVARQADWEDEHRGELRTAAKQLKELQSSAAKAKDHFDSLSKNKPKLEADLSEINIKLSSLDEYRQAVREAEQKLTRVQGEIQIKDRDLNHESMHMRSLKAEYAVVDRIDGQPCDSCGKPYTKDDIAPRKASLKKDLEECVKRYKELRTQRDDLNGKLSDAELKLKVAERAVPDTTKEIKRRDELSDALSAINSAEREASNAAVRVRDHMVQLKKLKGQENPNDALLENERNTLKEAQKEFTAIKKKIEALEKDLEVKRAAAQVFGPAGVRAHILDTVTPFLNDRTNHYLSTLTDSNVSALWSTIDTNSKGEIKEKFAIACRSKVGAHTFKGLSGGEKRKVRLACSMALQDLVSSRATKPIELYIADEIDDSVDVSGLERLMSILEEKAGDRGTVLVVSHNELSDWCSRHITVVKEGGKSHIEGDALA